MRDIINDLHPGTPGIATVTDNTAVVSGILDTAGYAGAGFLIAAGTLADADATFTVLVEEGDESDLSDASNVADADLVGTEALAGFQFDDDLEPRKIGYIGGKRYVRCTVTPANNTGSAPIGIIPIRRYGNHKPAANPPV